MTLLPSISDLRKGKTLRSTATSTSGDGSTKPLRLKMTIEVKAVEPPASIKSSAGTFKDVIGVSLTVVKFDLENLPAGVTQESLSHLFQTGSSTEVRMVFARDVGLVRLTAGPHVKATVSSTFDGCRES
ncbi:MAG: hypothetical protein QOK49_4275 [Baekduia sp.]|nr:hypothetical protein [Baekduia sp.]